MRTITPLLVIALIATLSACTPTPVPGGPAPSSSPRPTETVEPVIDEEDADPVPALIVIRREAFTIIDSEGTVTDSFGYMSDPAPAVARLTEVFGAAPVMSTDEGNFHEWPSDIYTWSGFSIVDYIGGNSIPFGADYEVASNTPAVGSIAIETVGGVSVGDSTATAVAAGGTAFSEVYDVTVSWVEIDAIADPNPEWAGWEGGPRIFVRLALDSPGGTITIIASPLVNYYV